MSQLRNWCFTLNNYTNDEYEKLKQLTCEYIILAKEIGDKGTPHIQGYVEFKGGKRITTLKKINDRIHWEARKGTSAQAIAYCKKDGNFEEIGTPKKQGCRTDLDDLAKKIVKREITKKDMVMENCGLYVKYHNGIDKIFTTTEISQDYEHFAVTIPYPQSELIDKLKELKKKHDSLFVCKNWNWSGYNNENAVAILYNIEHDEDIKLLIEGLKDTVDVKYGVKKITSQYIYVLIQDKTTA